MDDKTLVREIEALLAVEPAPEFRARVLRRIEEEPRLDGSRALWQPSWQHPSWRFVATAGLVAATAIGVVLLRTSPPPHSTDLPAQSLQAFSNAQPVLPNLVARVPTPAPHRRATGASRIGVTPNMLVIIDAAEVAAWHRLLASTGSGEVGLSASLQLPDESMQPLPEGFVLPPVTIEPLTPDFREQGVHP